MIDFTELEGLVIYSRVDRGNVQRRSGSGTAKRLGRLGTLHPASWPEYQVRFNMVGAHEMYAKRVVMRKNSGSDHLHALCLLYLNHRQSGSH